MPRTGKLILSQKNAHSGQQRSESAIFAFSCLTITGVNLKWMKTTFMNQMRNLSPNKCQCLISAISQQRDEAKK